MSNMLIKYMFKQSLRRLKESALHSQASSEQERSEASHMGIKWHVSALPFQLALISKADGYTL